MNPVSILLYLVLLFVAGTQAVARDMRQWKPGDYFESEVEFTSGEDGIPRVLLPTAQRDIRTQELPVKGGRKYRLVIAASVDDDFVIEKDYRAHIQTLKSHRYSAASHYRVSFLDENGEAIPGIIKRTPGGFFITRNRHPYTSVFYTPPAARALRILFTPNGRTTEIAGIRLEEETGEDAVNSNPDFRYGELSYCGWNPTRDGRLYTRPDGKTIFRGGYLASSDGFPLDPAKNYRIFSRGEGKGTISMEYYDQEGKLIIRRVVLRPTPEGTHKDVTPPEGTVHGAFYLLGGNMTLEELRIREQ